MFLPYGRAKLSVELPDSVNLTKLLPNDLPPISGWNETILGAIDSSRGKKLDEEPRGRTTIVVDDSTRPCPTLRLLEAVSPRLKVEPSAVKIIFAVGSHRPVRAGEARELIGRFCDRFTWVSHDAHGPTVDMGSTSRGTPVEISEDYASSDYRILLGDVEPHYFAGYGGGRKSILPGVSSFETMQANHQLIFDPRSDIGVLDGNPVHEDMEEGAMKVGADFTLNVVMNSAEQIVSAHAGGMRSVLRDGSEVSDEMYKVELNEPADLVIVAANGHPHDINMYQAYKGLHMGLRAVKRGGTVILVAECPDGAGNRKYVDYMRKYNSLEEVESTLRERFVLGAHKAYFQFRAVEKARVIAVTSMGADEVRNLHRMEAASSLQDAADSALAGQRDLDVVVMPYGSTTIPVFR